MDLKIFFLLGALVTGLPAEPSDRYLVSEEADNSVGLYFRSYAVLSDRVNYITARQIFVSGIGPDGSYYVETVAFPLFYWFDWNGDGDFNDEGEMFIDPETTGCGCNIKPYYSNVITALGDPVGP